MKFHSLFVSFCIVLGLTAPRLAVSEDAPTPPAPVKQYLTIGTGGLTGVYFTVGGAICRLVERLYRDEKLTCRAEATAGSIYNLNTLTNQELDFAIVQGDWHYQYAHDPEKSQSLRSVLSLHTESFTVFAHPERNINSFNDLKNKRVNIGNPGSGQRATMELMMDLIGWTTDDFLLATELKATEQSSALCDGSIDVAVYTVGHPAASLEEAITLCQARLIGLEPELIERMSKEYPYYQDSTIPAQTYSDQKQAVQTFGLHATLVTRAGVAESIVHAVTTSIIRKLKALKKVHPSLTHLDVETMIHESNFAPRHPGAIRALQELELHP